MRTIIIIQEPTGKYLSSFAEDGKIVWQITSYTIISHEVMVDWIENGKHPEYNYA